MTVQGFKAVLLTATACVIALPTAAQAQQRDFNVPASDARRSIPEFARQAGIRISAPTGQLHGVTTRPVIGQQDVRAALQQLLRGTGLSILSDQGGMIVLGYRRGATIPTATQTNASVQTVSPVAIAESPAMEPPGEDIIVTAQRRVQTLAKVPQSVSVVGEAQLERQNATSLVDYAKLVPGLNIQAQDAGTSRIILRGANTGSAATTVATYIDDVPFGSSGSLALAGSLSGDFDPFDITRIEVLRGPQGTLYGSNSLGGVVKYVTNAPSTQGFEARGQAGVETVSGGGTGWFGNAMVNVPLGETLALRASGFYRKRAGFMDAVGFDRKNVNDSDSYGGRAALLFQPTDSFSIRLQAVLQNIDIGSPSNFAIDPVTLMPVNPAAGVQREGWRTRFALLPENQDIRYRLYSGTLEWDFGGAALSSITSYARQGYFGFTDFSANPVRGLVNSLYAPTAPNTVGVAFTTDLKLKKFTQEVRLASTGSKTFEWTIGGYYTHEDTAVFQRYNPFEIATRQLMPTALTVGGVTYDDFVQAFIYSEYREIAGFASGTLHLSDRFDITAGGRYSHNKQSSEQAVIQLGVGSAIFGKSSEGVFTWSASPRFELSDHASVYGRVAKGYRPGGPNFIPAGAPANFPTEFNADTIVSYELGLRAETSDRSLSFDGALFYLDWSDILIVSTAATPAGPATVNSNGRRARSRGAEFAVTMRPTKGLTAIINGAYTDARLLDDLSPPAGGPNLAGGRAGDRLPYVPRFSGTFSVDYEWALSNDATAYIGGSVQARSDQTASYDATYVAAYGRQATLDGFATVDLRAGVDFDRFNISAFAINLTNSYGLSSVTPAFNAIDPAIGGSGARYSTASSIRPRTIGASVGFKF